MIAVNNEPVTTKPHGNQASSPCCPKSSSDSARAFRHLDPEAREDAIEEGVVHSLAGLCSTA